MPDSAPERSGGAGRSLPRTLLVMLAAAAVGYLASGGYGDWRRGREQAEREFSVMRTTAKIIVPAGSGSGIPNDEAARLAEEAVREVESLMGPSGELSDVRRLNEAPAGTWVEVSPLTWRVVMESMRWHRLTGGAFDPTVGPVKKLFTFSRDGSGVWPDARTLAEAGNRVGLENLRFDREGMRLSWKKDGMSLDLGAIAKGFSVDRAIEKLREQGVENALVDVGGEMFLLGRKAGDSPWRAGVRNPRGNDAAEVLEKIDSAVATSGDYEQFFMHDGRRYSHIINPVTGLPAEGGVAGATVIHPSSCMAADALATTLCVMGPVEGKKFLESQALGLFSEGVEAILYLAAETGGIGRVRWIVDKTGRVAEAGE